MCKGFKAAGIAAGIKKNKEKDLGIIYCETDAVCAAVFTKNRVKAAPVLLDMERVRAGTCRAVIANSGNANCCNGDAGMACAVEMAAAVARALKIPETEVLVASTGVIGNPFPIEKIIQKTPNLVSLLSKDGFPDFASAIMTTDTVPKLIFRTGEIDGVPFSVTGVAKGSGMIRPDMATMLCFVCTDIGIDADRLQAALSRANEKSFNRITVDGDTSTNDTVIVMANGASGAIVKTGEDYLVFSNILDDILFRLAKMIVADGEGATKCVTIIVNNAASDTEARAAADTVANSNLVKTALFGQDPNWGRIMGALGRSGAAFDPDCVDIFFNDAQMVASGQGCGDAAEARAAQILKQPEFDIIIDLHAGDGTASVLTCDLSEEYIRINADYRS
ncbi:MAG: bifunctional glutamate N-acetyltransferase/amino-acid acetyltransferase ArgJ [Deltaproteobacteria bacterium]|nr:bifunctional glutamate N-acetyltransferase/amino-acid acetyltransferase ArgJ [Deltaproteobacteria bacterium]